jgi:protoporphyrinogen oxidase
VKTETTMTTVRTSPSIGIIGGGLLGLSLALRLRAVGYEVVVYERAPRGGGLAAPWSIGEFTWDKFYHVILMSDLNVRRLLDELSLTDALRWNTTRTGFFTDGRLHSMSDSMEFLKFPPLRLLDKFRLGGTIFYASKLSDWQALEGVAVTDWLRRLSGERTFEKMWLPLLRAKLGENYGNGRSGSCSFRGFRRGGSNRSSSIRCTALSRREVLQELRITLTALPYRRQPIDIHSRRFSN